MKKLTKLILIAGLTTILVLPLASQAQMMMQQKEQIVTKQTQPMMGMMGMGKGMMGGMSGMMGGMMDMVCGGSQLHLLITTINTLPEKTLELNLSQKQFDKLVDLRTSFLKNKLEYTAELKKINFELQQLVKQKASSANIKKVLAKHTDIQQKIFLSAYDTYQNMLSTLTPEQQAKLNLNAGMMMPMGGHGKGMKK